MKHIILFFFLGIAAHADVSVEFSERIMPLLHNYCFDCHDPDDEEHGAPFFEAQTINDINKERHSWKSVAAQIRNRTMPPKRKKKQPTEEERIELANWIENFLQSSAKKMPEYAGIIKTRRLNRTQYGNTIRDLFGFDPGFSKSFPKDSSGGEGFDNNGETLYLPPLLMERYMEAAQKVLNRAIITPALNVELAPKKLNTFDIFLPGKYLVTINYEANENTELTLEIDGLAATSLDLSPDEKTISYELILNRGIHSIKIILGNDTIKVHQLHLCQNFKQNNKEEYHRKIFLHQHDNSPTGQRTAAVKNLKEFMSRAFRRPSNDSEVAKYMSLYDRAAQRQAPYEERLKLALNAVLLSPHFLFMVENQAKSSEIEPISNYELATRLSYFLWSSMPDSEIFDLAQNGSIQKPKVIVRLIDRMLEDPKAYSFYENFTSQWLGTDEVGGKHSPSGSLKKEYKYSPELGLYLREEPIQLFKHIVTKDRPLLDLIDSKYILANDLISKHYGMRKVKGKHFRKVKLFNNQRGGILGLGGVHMATSFPGRTSPVLRGAWVIETLLGTPVPAPPADVPGLAIKKKKNKNLSIRQIFEKHRENASCAACHDLIDPIGFGLDNYDLAGRWRTHEKGHPVNAKGTMPSGEIFDGPKQLKSMLLDRKDEFTRHLITKVLGYALGRSLMHEDAGTIERILVEAKENNYSPRALIKAVVLSPPFQNRQLISEEH